MMNRLYAILWKNGIIRIFRHKVLLVFLVSLPILLFVFIAYARSKISGFGKDYINETTYNDQLPANHLFNSFGGTNKLVYTPKTTFTDDLIRDVQLRFQIPNSDVEGLQTEEELLKYYKKNKIGDYKILGIVFLDVGQGIPKSLKYQLRPYEKDIDYDTNKLFHNQIQYINGIGSDKYKDKGLLALQLALDLAYIARAKGANRPDGKELPEIFFQEFPYPPYLNDHGFNELFAHILPLATLLSFILICPDLLKRLVEEKSTGIKELMKMMGMNTLLQWTGWFISSVLMTLFSIAAIVILMKVPIWHDEFAPIEYCSWSVYTVFLILYCTASISKCFLLSTFFHKPTVVIVFGIFFWLLSYIIPVSITNDETASFLSKMLLMLLPNMCLYYGYKAIAVYELREIGMHWNTIAASTDGGDNEIQMLHVFIMLLVDMILYIILAFYFDAVNPGPHGIKKPFSFPITAIMTFFKCKRSNNISCVDIPKNPEEIEVILEATNVDESGIGIRVTNLRKVYPNNVVAVNHLNVNFLKGEITALLGHNGAGKTTTLSILTGILNRTSGQVVINGSDIAENISNARQSMGICTQHNLFFQDLTVFEHLRFFGMVKGLTCCASTESARKLLKELHLDEKRNALPATLSGGMQRKLCLGIALCGDPDVLILDEPTSGMDVQTRRFIWDKLLERRRTYPNCTTVVSTHFMEEAEVIGDRIAIMNRGDLSCYGTLTYLKNKFDTGYRLKLTYIEPEIYDGYGRDEVDSVALSISNKDISSSSKEQRNALFGEFSSVVKIVESNEKFIECQMPTEKENRQLFLQFLKNLEENRKLYNIATINITNINLEDIYLKYLNTCKIENCDFTDGKSVTVAIENDPIPSVSKAHGEKGNFISVILQKRWHVFRNTICNTLIQSIPALLLISVLMLLMIKSYASTSVTFKMFKYNLQAYGNTNVYIGGTGNELNQVESFYSDLVEQEGSISRSVPSVSDAIVNAGKDNIAYYKRHMIAAAEFNLSSNAVNVMYSNTALHGAPISLNLVTNALVKWAAGPDYGIEAANFPLPGHKTDSADLVAVAQQLVLFILLFPIAIYTFLCTFISTPWQDLSSRMKYLQLMAGLTETGYWMPLLLFDLTICTIGFAFIIFPYMGLVFGCTGLVDWLGSWSALGILFFIVVSYAFAALPLAYIMSHLNSIPSAVNAFLISGLFAGFIPTVIIYAMEISNDEPYVNAAWYLSIALSFWPQFGLSYACLKYIRKTLWIYNWEVKNDAARKMECYFDYNPCCDDNNSWECGRYKSYLIGNDDAFGRTILYMIISAFIYIIILINFKKVYSWVEDIYNGCICKAIDEDSQESSGENSKNADSGNITKTQTSDAQESMRSFKVHKILKKFDKKTAVNELSFNVYKKSLFGILGVNGAGKSTTFKILAGMQKPTKGTAEILKSGSLNVELRQGSEYTNKMGYCPQEDFIVETLTGRQILNLFAGLRGVPKVEVDELIRRIGIAEYADICCGCYSGGTKRKLCMAIATLGNLPIMLLDEPTTGVDPKSKRDIWELLNDLRKDKECSIVLTSHSMDECEALTDTLLIMKEGGNEAEGTIPLLKEKYGHMYKLVFKARIGLQRKVVEENFGEEFGEKLRSTLNENPYTLFDQHGTTYNYHINKKNVRLSAIFEGMEKLFQKQIIIEYVVHEPSLEDVFLEIAKHTEEIAVAKPTEEITKETKHADNNVPV